MINPFASLFQSRKFMLLILDVIISGTTYFMTKYAAPDFTKDALFLIGLIQPVFVALIGAIAVEDNGERRLQGELSWQDRDESDGAPDA